MNTLIDTNVQPFFRSNSELLSYLPKQYQTRSIPDVESLWYQAPSGDLLDELAKAHPAAPKNMLALQDGWTSDQYPGSEPQLVSQHLFEERPTKVAILNPITRGNHPDYRLNNAICTAINEWLVERWLTEGNTHDRFRGTIRVNPEDATAAVKEIERFGDDPYMVQVGVPLQSREPYGKPQFEPIWEAAAAYDLPVAVRVTGGAGIEFAPTPAGHPRTYPHYAAFMPLNYFYHLASLIAEGTFERTQNLKFIFADGGIDILAPLIWRMDTHWYAARDMTPWVSKLPSSYVRDHVRFCFSKFEGPSDEAITEPWLKILDQFELLMFGSSYPYWYMARPDDVPDYLDSDIQEKIFWGNASNFYRDLAAK